MTVSEFPLKFLLGHRGEKKPTHNIERQDSQSIYCQDMGTICDNW